MLDVLAVAAVVGAITAACLPFLRSGERILLNIDWLQLASRHALLRQSVLKHGEIPLRTPFYDGGYPSFGDPEDPALNPLSLVTVAFGETRGLKLMAFVFCLGGGLGTFYLARRALGMAAPAALYAALVFGLSGWAPARHASGNVNELWLMATPLLFALLLRSKQRPAAVIGFAIVSAMMLTDGKLVWPGVMLMLAVFAIADGLRADGRRLEWNPNTALNLVRGAVLALLLCAPKLAAVFDLFRLSGSALSPELTFHTSAYISQAIGTYNLRELCAALFVMPSAPMAEAASRLFLGPLPLIAFALGAMCCFRSSWRWLVPAFVALWLMFGPNAPVDLFRVVYALPVYRCMSLPFKYFDVFVPLVVALVGARFVDMMQRRLPRRGFVAAGLVLMLAGVGPMTWGAARLHGQIFSSDRPSMAREGEFHHVLGVGTRAERDRPLRANMYFNALRNVGTLDAFLPVHITPRVEPRFFIDRAGRERPNSRYRGEAYFLSESGNSAEIVRLTSNTVELAVAVSAPDTLAINQNYDEHWRASRGVVQSHNGLLAVRFAEPGQYRLRLRYAPWPHRVGWVIAALTLAGIAATLVAVRWDCAALRRVRRIAFGSLPTLAIGPRVFFGACIAAVLVACALWHWMLTPMWAADGLLADATDQIQRGELDEAIASLERRMEIAPADAFALSSLGRLYLQKGPTARALDLLRRAGALAPANPVARRYLAAAYAVEAQYDRAIAESRGAIALARFDPMAHVELAQYLAKTEQGEDALDALERAVELGHDDADEIRSAPAFDALRDHPRFRRILADVSRDEAP